MDTNKTTAILAALLLAPLAALQAAETPAKQPNMAESLPPEDKKLDPAWVTSLTQRGGAMDSHIRGSRKDDTLKYIGMPVGGIGCGTVYLGGDGRLWVWDVFNQYSLGVVFQRAKFPSELEKLTKKDNVVLAPESGVNYVLPPTPDKFPPAFKQGFGLRIGEAFRRFDAKDWAEVEFDGKWPIGVVHYHDPACPVEVTLRGFSPFIPLDIKDSSLPLTFMEFTVRNTSDRPVTVDLSGWLQNATILGKGAKFSPPEALRESGPNLHLLTHEIRVPVSTGKPGKETASAVVPPADNAGSMALGVLDPTATPRDQDGVPGWSSRLQIEPGESKTVTFLLTWHFPNIYPLPGFPDKKHEYASRFTNAAEVARFAADHYPRLRDGTSEWVKTWYDSTLPQWFMDRTILTADTLQTANCYLFEDGQFWGWEGIGSSPGTCLHVWQYAQGIARLFPSLERNLREVTDFGYAQDNSGLIRFRGKGNGMAVDGQAGVILRTYREHLMSPDDAFLRRVWPKTRLAMERLIKEDGNDDGILEGGQHNTLDSSWYGPVAWLSGEYQAALRAAEKMALIMGDSDFAEKVRGIYTRGETNLVSRLYNGEYFINLPDPSLKKPNGESVASAINSGSGCLIDQVFGQSWAFQVGLDRVLPEKETRSALDSLWRYNFVPDIGVYRATHAPGRWYALPGESGLVMCTFPRPDWSFEKASGVKNGKPNFAGYFFECMSGFEYQVASHMIYEGTPELVEKGLAITRAVHDRYAPAKRNPYNEIECSDHYARAAASYGVFLAACGFDYNGPAGHIGFAPKITPEDFKAPFTAAQGWGTFSQKAADGNLTAEIAVKWGELRLRSISLATVSKPASATVEVNGKTTPANISHTNGTCTLTLPEDVILTAGQAIHVVLKTI